MNVRDSGSRRVSNQNLQPSVQCDVEVASRTVTRLGIAGFIRKHDMGSKFTSQLVQQFRLHELIIVGDVKRDDPLALDGLREFGADAIQVRLLHDEDYVSPTDVPLSDD